MRSATGAAWRHRFDRTWKPSHYGRDRAATSLVALTHDQARLVHARLLDVTPGGPGTAYSRRLAAKPDRFTATVDHAFPTQNAALAA